jgi:hypothetical protein
MLTFFGGVFLTLIAAGEAAYLFGWAKISASLLQLQRGWRAARVAFKRDNLRDEDGNGVADVDEMSAQQLATRRFLVLSRSVDPATLSAAIEGLSTASLAILATCWIRFAYAITIGSKIGDVIDEMVLGPRFVELLRTAIPDDYEKWIPVVCRYLERYVGITLAWFLMRVTSSAFSAMRGAELLVSGIAAFLVRYGYVDRWLVSKGQPALTATWGLVAMCGLYWQLSSGFRPPFPLNIIFLPLILSEKIIVGFVGVQR